MPSSYRTGIGTAYHALDVNAQMLARDGLAVVDGCQPSVSATTLGVDIASGRVQERDTTRSVASTTLTVPDPDATHPRKDVIFWDPSASTFDIATGDPRPVPDRQPNATRFGTIAPSPPPLATGDAVPIAEVWVAAQTGDIVPADIADRRVTPARPVVAASAGVTLTAGQPAIDTRVQDVDADPSDALRAVVRADQTPPDGAAWNVSHGVRYDGNAGRYDVDVTVTWDTDPGQAIDGRIDVINTNT